jgi:hypothetical protein
MSKARLKFLICFAFFVLFMELSIQSKGQLANLFFVICILLSISSWLIRCEECKNRAVLNLDGKIIPSFRFMFSKKCPHCNTSRI